MDRTSKKSNPVISIQNIYYMLSYAFHILNKQGYKKIATEEFHNVAELCAAILATGVSSLIKRGLGREYMEQTETLSTLRGKIDISESIKKQTFLRKQLICSYDEFSVNSYMNRIIKTTTNLLLKSDISKTRKKQLRKLMVFFVDVDLLDITEINWRINYNRNNQTYRMLISICYLVVKGLLQTTSEGSVKLMNFLDEQRMSRLFEKFVLEFYRREYPQISVNASQIPWSVDDGVRYMLPIMQSDVTLKFEDKILIIDTKFYARTTQKRYNTQTLHSANLYQMFAYVKNWASQKSRPSNLVSGLILYEKPDDDTHLDESYVFSGNEISVKTINLNIDFNEIAGQLNDIVNNQFDLDMTPRYLSKLN